MLPRRPWGRTSELEILKGTGEVAEIQQQVLGPLGRPLADGVGLGSLVVGVGKGGHVLVLEGKLAKVVNDLGKAREEQLQSLLYEDELSVVSHKTTGSREVNNSCGCGRILPVCMDVSPVSGVSRGFRMWTVCLADCLPCRQCSFYISHGEDRPLNY